MGSADISNVKNVLCQPLDYFGFFNICLLSCDPCKVPLFSYSYEPMAAASFQSLERRLLVLLAVPLQLLGRMLLLLVNRSSHRSVGYPHDVELEHLPMH